MAATWTSTTGRRQSTSPREPNQPLHLTGAALRTLVDAGREHIVNVVRETGRVLGGPKGAAARLGMKRSTLRWKMKRLGISRSR